jgi:putative ABC transport system permease protein
VGAVRPYQGGLLDLGDRRVWLIARDAGDRDPVPPSQILSGDADAAARRLARGGWVAVSEQIADALDVHAGGTVALPTPSGRRTYRVAATTTNLGWGPGAIVIGGRDYRRAWRTRDVTALEVDVRPGADVEATRAAVARAVAPVAALRVQTAGERTDHAVAVAQDGLARLSQISVLLLVAAVLAVAAAMGGAIWQRRAALAQLRMQGYRSIKLWRALLFETGLVLVAGTVTGALTGIYGNFLLGRWLELTTGYPAPFGISAWQTALTCVLVATAALAITAIPGHLATRAPVRLGLQD